VKINSSIDVICSCLDDAFLYVERIPDGKLYDAVTQISFNTIGIFKYRCYHLNNTTHMRFYSEKNLIVSVSPFPLPAITVQHQSLIQTYTCNISCSYGHPEWVYGLGSEATEFLFPNGNSEFPGVVFLNSDFNLSSCMGFRTSEINITTSENQDIFQVLGCRGFLNENPIVTSKLVSDNYYTDPTSQSKFY